MLHSTLQPLFHTSIFITSLIKSQIFRALVKCWSSDKKCSHGTRVKEEEMKSSIRNKEKLSPRGRHGESSTIHHLLGKGQVWERMLSAYKCWEQLVLCLSGRSTLAEHRDHSLSDHQQTGTAHLSNLNSPTLPGQQEWSQLWQGRWKLERCTHSAQAFTSPRALLLSKPQAQKLTPLPFHPQPFCNTPQFPVSLILPSLQALKLHNKSAVLWKMDHKNPHKDLSPPAESKVCCVLQASPFPGRLAWLFNYNTALYLVPTWLRKLQNDPQYPQKV